MLPATCTFINTFCLNNYLKLTTNNINLYNIMYKCKVQFVFPGFDMNGSGLNAGPGRPSVDSLLDELNTPVPNG